MKKIGEFIKKHKLIFGGICCLAVATILFFIYFTAIDKKEDVLTDKGKENVQEVIKEPDNVSNDDEIQEKLPDAPAKDTKKLLKSMKEVEVKSVTADTITLSNDVNVKKGEKIAVWVYSEPKFLGYFEVMVKNGEKFIKGLADALKNISVEAGDHNIALVSEKGKNIGYIDIYIKKSGEIKEYTTDTEEKKEEPKQEDTINEESKNRETKEIKEEKEISFKTETIDEVNMLKGKKEVVQKGVNGTKEITYKITYENGKEISREKVSEKITKEAIGQIEKVGISDFNINTDFIEGMMLGYICTEEETFITPDGLKSCNDELNLSEFYSTNISGQDYVIKFAGDSNIKAFKIEKVGDFLYSGTYKGILYYFDGRAGDGEKAALTIEKCNDYGLSCGAW
ncbi:MAG: G5 domain-containing protein [Bacilli bacterium]|nr:G5 domain-containing protein [Bacilli bacterium]